MFSASPALPAARDDRWLALAVLCAGTLMIVLDATIVNVALPAIKNDLGFSQSSLAWVVNAYLIAFGGILLLAGRLGDLVGRRRIFLLGLTIFTAASLLCGLAQSQEVLIGARFVQGVGGAMTSAVILGVIVTMFPEPDEQARAIGVYSFVAAAGGSIGLLAGGVLTQSINWHWIFFVNLPIGVATAVLAARLLERDEGIGVGEGVDLPGAVLLTSSLMAGVYTIVGASDHGWGSGHTLGFGSAALALLVAFVAREARTSNPLVPLRIFRSRVVAGANAVQALMVAGMFGMFFLGALYLQRVQVDDAHRRPARGRGRDRLGSDRRLPPRLRHRGRARGRERRPRGDAAAAAARRPLRRGARARARLLGGRVAHAPVHGGLGRAQDGEHRGHRAGDRPGGQLPAQREDGEDSGGSHELAAAERAHQPRAERGVPGEVGRDAAAQREARGRVERLGDVVDRDLDPDGEDDDPRDQHQVEIAVGVGGGQDRIVVAAQALLCARRGAVEVRPPQLERDEQRQRHRGHHRAVDRAPAGTDADRHDRLPEAD